MTGYQGQRGGYYKDATKATEGYCLNKMMIRVAQGFHKGNSKGHD